MIARRSSHRFASARKPARGSGGRLGAGGFTLLEMLIATAVGAIVLLVINATFFSALRLHNTTHEKIDNDLALQRVLVIVRKDLAGVMLPGGVLSGTFQTNAFTSSSMDPAGERISPDIFTDSGRVDGWTSYGDVQMVAYSLAPATDGSNSKTLVRSVTRNLLPTQDTVYDEQPLLPGVQSATMEFYDGYSWTEEWDSTVTNTLPRAIKLSLVMATTDFSQPTPAPIELIVPVMVQTTTTQQEDAAAAAQNG